MAINWCLLWPITCARDIDRGGLPSVGGLSKRTKPVFVQGSRKTTENFEWLGRRARHEFEPSTFCQQTLRTEPISCWWCILFLYSNVGYGVTDIVELRNNLILLLISYFFWITINTTETNSLILLLIRLSQMSINFWIVWLFLITFSRIQKLIVGSESFHSNRFVCHEP